MDSFCIEGPCLNSNIVKQLCGLEFQKLLHLMQCLVQRQFKAAAAWPRAGEAQLVLQLAVDHLEIRPAQHLLAP
jgi:hypothetical protein